MQDFRAFIFYKFLGLDTTPVTYLVADFYCQILINLGKPFFEYFDEEVVFSQFKVTSVLNALAKFKLPIESEIFFLNLKSSIKENTKVTLNDKPIEFR